MAMARLLLPKSEICFSNTGFFRSTRWRFSSSYSSSSSSDGRKSETVSDSDSFAKIDTSQKKGPQYAWESILTHIKQKVLGCAQTPAKTSGEDSGLKISASAYEVSAKEFSSGDSADMPAPEVVSSLKNSEETKFDSLSSKQSSNSKMVSQIAIESISQIEASRENKEELSVKTDQLENISGGSELALKKEEQRYYENSLDFLIDSLDQTSRCRTSLGETRQNSQPEMEQTHQEKSHWIKIEDFGKNLDSDQEPNPLLMFEELDNTFRTFTKELRSHAALSRDQSAQFGMKLVHSSQNAKSSSKGRDAPGSPDDLGKPNLSDRTLKATGNDQTGGILANIDKKSMGILADALKAEKVEEDTVSLRSLLDCIKIIPSDNVKDTEMAKPLSKDNLQSPKVKRSKSSLKGKSINNSITKSNGEKEQENSGASLIVKNGSVCSQDSVASFMKEREAKESSFAFAAGELTCNTVLLRFLHAKIGKKDILDVFDSCGFVLDMQEIESCEGCIYRDALLTFGTSAAFQMALKKTDARINDTDVLVEAAFPEDMVDRASIPNVLGDPDVPVALVKEPTQTVKVQPLTHGINGNQVKEAFAFCGSNISSFFLGSSSSSAFVEFETEDAKERAIAEHSISIAGKQLFITRIDVPRTTVVRLSNLTKNTLKDINALCAHYGRVKRVITRAPYIVDVHFKLAEWPNMLNILNSLNGKEMDGKKLVAQPAPIIPPEIISILWEQPDGKRYIKERMKGLLRKLEQSLDTSHTSRIANELL